MRTFPHDGPIAARRESKKSNESRGLHQDQSLCYKKSADGTLPQGVEEGQ